MALFFQVRSARVLGATAARTRPWKEPADRRPMNQAVDFAMYTERASVDRSLSALERAMSSRSSTESRRRGAKCVRRLLRGDCPTPEHGTNLPSRILSSRHPFADLRTSNAPPDHGTRTHGDREPRRTHLRLPGPQRASLTSEPLGSRRGRRLSPTSTCPRSGSGNEIRRWYWGLVKDQFAPDDEVRRKSGGLDARPDRRHLQGPGRS